MKSNKFKLINLLQITDNRGQLTVAECKHHIPFEIRRIYFISDVVKGAHRGGHAHRTLQQVIIAIKGSFDIYLDDGHIRTNIHLDSNHVGLYVGSMTWRKLTSFSDDAICLVLASNDYDDTDYYADYVEFINDLNKAG